MYHTSAKRSFSGIPATLIEELRRIQFNEVEQFAFVTYPRSRSYNVETLDGKKLPYEDLYTMEVDSSYYSVFTPKVLQGSWEVASQTPNTVILTRSLAQKIFGIKENPIGKQIDVYKRQVPIIINDNQTLP